MYKNNINMFEVFLAINVFKKTSNFEQLKRMKYNYKKTNPNTWIYVWRILKTIETSKILKIFTFMLLYYKNLKVFTDKIEVT